MIYTKAQLEAIYDMAKIEKRVDLDTPYNKRIYLVMKLWSKGEQLRAYLNHVTQKPQYNGGTRFRSISLGYIDLRTGETHEFNNGWDDCISKMDIPAPKAKD